MTGWVDNGSGLSAGRSRMFVAGDVRPRADGDHGDGRHLRHVVEFRR